MNRKQKSKSKKSFNKILNETKKTKKMMKTSKKIMMREKDPRINSKRMNKMKMDSRQMIRRKRKEEEEDLEKPISQKILFFMVLKMKK